MATLIVEDIMDDDFLTEAPTQPFPRETMADVWRTERELATSERPTKNIRRPQVRDNTKE